MSQDYFELFELKPTPALRDNTFVSKKYQQLQKKYHPDFFTLATEEEREEALQKSATVNEAYKVLKDKYALIAYYLQVNDMLLVDEKYSLPPDFLMEMMELNENFSENPDVVKEVKEYISDLEEDVDPVLYKNSDEHDEKDHATLKEFYYKAKYLQRLLDRI